YLRTKDAKSHIVDHALDDLVDLLDPQLFFRINRHMIVSSNQINSIDAFFNNRLILQLSPKYDEDVLVSREKVKAFKQWLDQ
ncbi:MAG: LytTR family DNA-binding domain-containing protein, partial [Ekhidna sp.]